MSQLQEGAGSQAEPTCCLKLPLCTLVASAQRIVFPCLSLPVGGKRERDKRLSSSYGIGHLTGSTLLDCFRPLSPSMSGLPRPSLEGEARGDEKAPQRNLPVALADIADLGIGRTQRGRISGAAQ